MVPDRWKGTIAESYWRNEKKCRALIKKAGSVRKAAAVIGISLNTIYRWINPSYEERCLRQKHERWVNDPVFRMKKRLRKSICRCRKRIAAKELKLEQSNKELAKCVERLM